MATKTTAKDTGTAKQDSENAPDTDVACIVLLPLRRNGTTHAIDDPITLPAEEFTRLRAQGVVREGT